MGTQEILGEIVGMFQIWEMRGNRHAGQLSVDGGHVGENRKTHPRPKSGRMGQTAGEEVDPDEGNGGVTITTNGCAMEESKQRIYGQQRFG